jgi:hypothetical protein
VSFESTQSRNLLCRGLRKRSEAQNQRRDAEKGHLCNKVVGLATHPRYLLVETHFGTKMSSTPSSARKTGRGGSGRGRGRGGGRKGGNRGGRSNNASRRSTESGRTSNAPSSSSNGTPHGADATSSPISLFLPELKDEVSLA